MKDLSILHSAVYGDCKAFFLSLTPAQRKDACDFIGSNHLEGLFLPELAEILPPEVRTVWRNHVQELTVFAMRNQHGLQKLCQLFESQHIRHCCLKGTDLAYRIYPEPAMRPFSDWDILFYPDDLPRAIELLQQNGWKQTIPDLPQSARHHLTPLQKGNFTLEPHFTLPNFTHVIPLELWTEIRASAPNSCHWILSPELNLLMLTRHAASRYYKHESLYKLLLDTAFLLKHESIDWNRVHQLADQWKLPRPDDILCAWSEFFPKEILEKMSPDWENCQTVREIFSGAVQKSSNSWQLALQDDIFSLCWLKKRLIAFQPSLLRHKFQNWSTPYPILLLRDLRHKTKFFLRHFLHPELAIRRHLDAVHKIENSGKNRQ